MGSPAYLNREQIEELIKASELKKEKVSWGIVNNNEITFDLSVLPHSVVAVTIKNG